MADTTGVLARVLLVGLGGFLGANARFWIGTWVQQRMGTAFPWGTFVINVSGSFVLGLVATLLTERIAPDRADALRLLVAVGVVGAYTTFSTFEYETMTLAQSHSLLRAFANALGSLVAGFAAVYVGTLLGRVR